MYQIIIGLTDTEGSFVIPNSEGTKFYIHGYYVSVDSLDSFKAGNTDIYASVLIRKQPPLNELVGQDDNGEFTGVTFSNTTPVNPNSSDYNMYYLKLLTLSNDTWIVPPESYTKFTQKSLPFEVDGGILS